MLTITLTYYDLVVYSTLSIIFLLLSDSTGNTTAPATATSQLLGNGTNPTVFNAALPQQTVNNVAASTTAASAQPSSAGARLPPSSSSSGTSAGGNAGTSASREVLRKVEEMGFSKEDISKAVRHLQQIGE